MAHHPRTHKYIGIAVVLVLFVIPGVIHAASFGRTLSHQIGGRVTTGPAELASAIVCTAAYGPFLMLPFTLSVPGPFFIRNPIHGIPRPNGYLIGSYSATPDMSACINPETGTPIPAFEINSYGVSR